MWIHTNVNQFGITPIGNVNNVGLSGPLIVFAHPVGWWSFDFGKIQSPGLRPSGFICLGRIFLMAARQAQHMALVPDFTPGAMVNTYG